MAVAEDTGTSVRRLLDSTAPDARSPLQAMMAAAQKDHGWSLPGLMTDMARLSFGTGKISSEEYFDLRLFDEQGLAGASKHEFLGMRGCKWLGHQSNRNEHWYAVVGNKLVFDTLMAGFGLPTIRSRAYYHPTARLPALGMLRGVEDISTFLRRDGVLPLFGKPVNGSLSLGSIAIDGYDRKSDRLRLTGGRIASPQQLAEEIVATYPRGYLFQEQLVPHLAVSALIGERIGTVRVYTFWEDFRPKVVRACWKMPTGHHRADNFWRTGNMLAAFDIDSGEILRVIRGSGLDQQEVGRHPDTNVPLIGAKVPHWQAVADLAVWAAGVLPHVRLIGWDIAVTDRGPVLVEANNTPDFRLVQMVERRGALDARMKAFLDRTEKLNAAHEKSATAELKKARGDKIGKAFGSARKAG